MLKRSFLPALVFAGALVLGGCDGTPSTIAANDLSSNDADDADDEEELVSAVQCAVQLDAVAKLPAPEVAPQIDEESDSPAATAEEHASLAQLYRGQAEDIAKSLGKSAADIQQAYRQAGEDVERQRKARTPDDFAAWLGGEADSCPPLLPDGSS